APRRKRMAATLLIRMARVDRPAKADRRVRRPVAEEDRDPKQADQGVASQVVAVQEVRKPAKARGAAAASLSPPPSSVNNGRNKRRSSKTNTTKPNPRRKRRNLSKSVW